MTDVELADCAMECINELQKRLREARQALANTEEVASRAMVQAEESEASKAAAQKLLDGRG